MQVEAFEGGPLEFACVDAGQPVGHALPVGALDVDDPFAFDAGHVGAGAEAEADLGGGAVAGEERYGLDVGGDVPAVDDNGVGAERAEVEGERGGLHPPSVLGGPWPTSDQRGKDAAMQRPTWHALLGVPLLLSVFLAPWFLRETPVKVKIELGTVAEAATGLVTAGTLVYIARSFRRQEQDRSEAQASKVTAWAVAVINPLEGPSHSVILRLQNASDLPIYSPIAVVLIDIWPMSHEGTPGSRPPRTLDETRRVVVSHPFGTLIPTTPTPQRVSLPSAELEEAIPVDTPSTNFVEYAFLQFRDANGRCWLRDHRGRLAQRDPTGLDELAEDASRMLDRDLTELRHLYEHMRRSAAAG